MSSAPRPGKTSLWYSCVLAQGISKESGNSVGAQIPALQNLHFARSPEICMHIKEGQALRTSKPDGFVLKWPLKLGTCDRN